MKRRPKLSEAKELARTLRLLDEFVAKHDRIAIKADRKANPLLLVTLSELSDTDVRFVAEPWRRKPSANGQLDTSLRCDAMAIATHTIREQTVAKKLRELHERAPVRAVARYIYSSARASELLAWFERQRRSRARDAMLRPLRRAVARKHAFSIMFDTL